MRTAHFAILLSAILSLSPGLARSGEPGESGQPEPPLVLLSIDGLRPDYVLEADRLGLELPNLRRLMKEGVFASGVRGVLPTVTYPSHTTMLTGVSPRVHGIVANGPFDPFGKNQGGWYWYAEDIRVPTLWELAEAAGLETASVDWPVSVGARVRYNIVQYWRAATLDDRKLIRALSTEGLLKEAEQAVGPYPEGYDYDIEADVRRAAFMEFLLGEKRPRFLTGYFAGLDTLQHDQGPGTMATFEGLEVLDRLVGRLRATAERVGGGEAVIAVVSDHGFLPASEMLHLNAALREAGGIEVDASGELVSWRAFAHNMGGSAAVMLRTREDDETRARVRARLEELRAAPDSGIARILEGDAIMEEGGFPDAAFVVGLKPGFHLGDRLSGEVYAKGTLRGVHGYLADQNHMDASFFLAGKGVSARGDLGRIDMRDIAPTLAALLGVRLPQAEGRNLLERRARR